MSYTKTKGKTLNVNTKNRSDGSELIPAGIQLNISQDEIQSLDAPVATGYTTDDEGIINTYAIEPDIYAAEYPSPRQQRQYVFLGAGAILFVATLTLVAFAVS